MWKKSGSDDLASVDGYSVAVGTFNSGAQVSTLELTTAVNDEDMVYTCDVTAPGAGQTAQSTTVTLNVFGNTKIQSYKFSSVNFESFTISCKSLCF